MGLSRTSMHGSHPHALPTPVHHPEAAGSEVPCHHLPRAGMGVEAAYDLITAELLLDGAARLNPKPRDVAARASLRRRRSANHMRSLTWTGGRRP